MTTNIVVTYMNTDKSIPAVCVFSNEHVHKSCWPPSKIPSVFSHTICTVTYHDCEKIYLKILTDLHVFVTPDY
jgi:hypothetical protein